MRYLNLENIVSVKKSNDSNGLTAVVQGVTTPMKVTYIPTSKDTFTPVLRIIIADILFDELVFDDELKAFFLKLKEIEFDQRNEERLNMIAKINSEMNDKLPSADELRNLFKRTNAELVESGNAKDVVGLHNTEFYTNEIIRLYNVDQETAKSLAFQVARASV